MCHINIEANYKCHDQKAIMYENQKGAHFVKKKNFPIIPTHKRSKTVTIHSKLLRTQLIYL